MFQVMCMVTGGVTGTRMAVLRDAEGNEKVFTTFEEANTEADRLNRQMNGNPYRTAEFRYWPEAR